LLEALPIDENNIDALDPLYETFRKVAEEEYGWPMAAIGMKDLKMIFLSSLMHGYLLHDYSDKKHVGFMFNQYETYGALEIKVIYLQPDVSLKSALGVLMDRLFSDAKEHDSWKVLSYPILGKSQFKYTDFITWYGFRPVGQSVVKFNLFDAITIEIFKGLQFKEPPEGFKFISWDPKYQESVIDVLTESFSTSVDALWDPRFRTAEGITEAVTFLQSGGYGLFYPECNSILVNDKDQAVGVCFMNIVSQEEANIPLIGLRSSVRNLKLGKSLLAHSVNSCIKEVLEGKLGVSNISATVATENFPAVKMYRHVGFQEDHWYPHVYQDRSSMMARRPGQWC